MRTLVGGQGAGRGEERKPGGESEGALASRARGQGGPLRAATEQGSVPPDSDWRRGQVSRLGDVPAGHRRPGARLCSEGRDVVWCDGEDRHDTVRPS